MKALAVIPARGGSKGIPGKNTRVLPDGTRYTKSGQLHDGMRSTPLSYAIAAGQGSRLVTEVCVSSDHEPTLVMARNMGAVGIRRPKELATDWAPTDPVIVHAVKERRSLGVKFDWVVLLQPTCPVRPPGIVDACLERAEELGADSLFTCYDGHFVWRRPTSSQHKPMLVNGLIQDRKPRQLMRDDEKVWVENGSVYVVRTEALLATGQRITGKVELYEMAKEDSIDIDTEYDFWLAGQRLKWLREREAEKVG